MIGIPLLIESAMPICYDSVDDAKERGNHPGVYLLIGLCHRLSIRC